ncbi:FliH/SctL family protein [Chitinilyticum litopenaei]|uniref:FliH/SctL family protein n=1 Tax=Chitinilyticum litopenaei TaxID=1121276 RepID=UPI0003FF12FB|nr:FliH/SctL family protein [Chitinilyticum litopenaei]
MASNPRRVIPREELSGFQRWQFGSLLDPAPQGEPEPQVVDEPPVEVPPQGIAPEPFSTLVEEDHTPNIVEELPAAPPLPYPTAEEIEAIQQQAHDEGYQAGLAAGRAQAADELARLQQLCSRHAEWLSAAEAELAEETLDLALTIARQVVRDTLRADPVVLLAGVREVLASLPAVRAPARMQLNPADLVLLRDDLLLELPEDTWRLVPDPSLPPGGCRIETPASSVDISLSRRWQAQLQVLRREDRQDLALDAADMSLPPSSASDREDD